MGRSAGVGHDNLLNVMDCGSPPGPTTNPLDLCNLDRDVPNPQIRYTMNIPIRAPESAPAQSALATEVERRRTFAIISHPDAGKTTLTEKLLLFGGAIQLAGQVKAKRARRSTRSDWMSIERERGISVVTSVMTFEYDGRVFNLLDTPGHEDFSEDTYRTLTAVELGGDGDRCGQGHRAADPQAL